MDASSSSTVQSAFEATRTAASPPDLPKFIDVASAKKKTMKYMRALKAKITITVIFGAFLSYSVKFIVNRSLTWLEVEMQTSNAWLIESVLGLTVGMALTLSFAHLFCEKFLLHHCLPSGLTTKDLEDLPYGPMKTQMSNRCIYSESELRDVIETGKAMVLLKMYRGDPAKLSPQCSGIYTLALEFWSMNREMHEYKPIHFLLDFSPKNSYSMSFIFYYKKEKLSEVFAHLLVIPKILCFYVPVICDEDGEIIPHAFSIEWTKQIYDLKMLLDASAK
uniref:Uncharacterized protein n=1 Tax=Ditylenchus dipsaci TaxID=166011 RepID=A0A915E980_9BILA